MIETGFKLLLSKANVVKACVFEIQSLGSGTQHVYCGNYHSTKLLLSRLSWNTGKTTIGFFDLSVKGLYNSMMHSNIAAISAIERWDEVLNYSVSARWIELINYLHDGVLNNKTKESCIKYIRGLCL